MHTFFINWQDPETRKWLPVAKLVQSNDVFIFGYTKGAHRSNNFLPFGSMNDLGSLYLSHDLFPIFANRAMNEKRPEYVRYLQWADLAVGTDQLSLMARIGGVRATDALQVFPAPERSHDGKYRSVFFSHGISHLPEATAAAIASLKNGDSLFPMLDIHNPFDPHAICLRTTDPATLVGYCPRYLAHDLGLLAKQQAATMTITVKKVNLDAPSQFRLLCEAVSTWPDKFVPCDTEEHKMISSTPVQDVLSMYEASKEISSPHRKSVSSARESLLHRAV